MKAIDFLMRIKWIPCIDLFKHPKDEQGNLIPVCSKAERIRLLKNKAVQINGTRPGPMDEIIFPIQELVFFPNGARKCTMVYESKVDQDESILLEENTEKIWQ